MIGAALDKLCDFADGLHSEGHEPERRIVQRCISLINIAYGESENAKQRVYNKKPDDDVEELVLSIPNLGLYYDPTDKEYFYMLDDAYFQSAKEVLRYVIDCRSSERKRAAAHAKRDALKLIQQLLNDAKVDVEKHALPENAMKGQFKKQSMTKEYFAERLEQATR